jgi:hypothetical protein
MIRPEQQPNELREFLMVLRRALLMVCKYIEHKYPEGK